MSTGFDDLTPTEKICQGLLKQKSRRLIDGVLKKRMVMDVTKGYGDERQYNAMCRSLLSRTGRLSSALEGLRYIRQKRLAPLETPHYEIYRLGSIFRPLAGSEPCVRLLPIPDRNGNFVTEPLLGQHVSTKPPFAFLVSHTGNTKINTPVQSKDAARSAITNVLCQSTAFANFARGNLNSSYGTDTQVSDGSIRNIPIKIEHKRTKNRNQQAPRKHDAMPKCKSTVYIPISNKGNGLRVPSFVNSNNESVGDDDAFLPKRNTTPSNSKQISSANGILAHNAENSTQNPVVVNHSPRVQSEIRQLSQKGSSGQKFRVKKIQIANGGAQAGGDQKKSHYVTEVKVNRSSHNLQPVADYVENGTADANGTSTNKSLQNRPASMYESPREPVQPSNFIKGMTFSATPGAKPSCRTSLGAQRALKVTPYNNKSRNKSSHPQAGVLTRQDVWSPESGPSNVASDAIEEKSSTISESKADIIPRFYFPKGKPRSKDEIAKTFEKIADVFNDFADRTVGLEDMGRLAKACNLPLYWKGPLFQAAIEDADVSVVSEAAFVRMWKRIASTHHDAASKFIALLAKPDKNYLDFEDFLPLLKDIVDTHPGLVFLKDAAEFHTRYMNTVIARIFYVINRSWSGQITASEIRKSNFLTVLSLLEEEDDINAVTDYFSYEHFYVIYCKFWELDTDHDLVVDKHDLLGYGDGVLSSRLIERVLSGAVTRWDTSDHQLRRMSYVDFVWFILSEEDKKTSTSIEYWFRCMDLDGDGVISMFEMEYFYEEQAQKLEQLDIEPLPFEDCVCQIFDIVNPANEGKVSLRDLKFCKMAHVFFDTFFNVAKYLNNEQKDPFIAQNSGEGSMMVLSDWDNFAAEEYELLVAEEQSNKMADMSRALLDDDEGIEVLEDAIPDVAPGDGKMHLSITRQPDEEDINTEFTELNFVDSRNADKRAPLTQT